MVLVVPFLGEVKRLRVVLRGRKTGCAAGCELV